MPALFLYKKLLRLSWLRATHFSSMKIIEFPTAKKQNVFDRIDNPSKHRFSVYSFFFYLYILKGKFLTSLTEASITDEKQFSQNLVIKIDHM